MSDTRNIFTSKIYVVDEILPLLDKGTHNIIYQYAGVNCSYSQNSNTTNQTIESGWSSAAYQNYPDRSIIRIIEVFSEGFRLLCVPTSPMRSISRGSAQVVEKLIEVYREKWNQPIPFCMFAPEVNSQFFGATNLENKLYTPTTSARGIQWYLNELLLRNVRIIANSSRALVVQEKVLDSNLDSVLKGTASSEMNVIKMKHGAAPEALSFLKAPPLDAINLELIKMTREALMSCFGLTSQVLGEYMGGSHTSYALEHLRQKTSRTSIEGLKRNYYTCFEETAKKIIYLYLGSDQSMPTSKKEQIFDLLRSGVLRFKLKETYNSHLEKDFHSYIYTLELLQAGVAIPPEFIVKNSPIENKDEKIKEKDSKNKH